MAARESAIVALALADHAAGMSVRAAALKHGVAPSSITRAMRRRGKPVSAKHVAAQAHGQRNP